MQDKAIQARTELRLDTELAQQKQKLQDFKLSKQQARVEQSMLTVNYLICMHYL